MRHALARVATGLALLSVAASSAVAQTTGLFLDSQAGDTIGQGERRTLTWGNARFAVESASPSSVTITATNMPGASALSYSLTFRAPDGSALTPGAYERAKRAAVPPVTLPGLDVTRNGQGCNQLSGRFVIHELSFTGRTLDRFAADFEQHCGGAAPALFGAIRFASTNSSLMPFGGRYPLYSLTLSPSAGGRVTGSGIDCGGGMPDCAETFAGVTDVTLTPAPAPGFVFVGWAGDCSDSPAVIRVDRPRLCIPVFETSDGRGDPAPDGPATVIFVTETGSADSSRRRVVYPSTLAAIQVQGTRDSVHVGLAAPLTADAHFTFVPPVGGALAPGDYPYALDTTEGRATAPGVRSSYCGSGGRFRVYELTFAANTVSSFAADLEQRCGSASRPLLVAIRYRAMRASLRPFGGAAGFHRLATQATIGGRVTGTGIDCGDGRTDCDEAFPEPATVSLRAVAAPGYEFMAWSGACGGDSPSIDVAVGLTSQCIAYFHPAKNGGREPDPSLAARLLFLYQPGSSRAPRRVWSARDATFTTSTFQGLTVSARGGHGGGSVTIAAPRSAPALARGDYDEAYQSPNATAPKLAIPGCAVSGGRFRVYEVATSAGGEIVSLAADFEAQCATSGPVYGAVRFNSTRAVVWPFEGAFPISTLSIVPSRGGRVTGAGIDCGPAANDCRESFPSARRVPLVAAAHPGSVFVGWQGGCDGLAETTVMVTGSIRCGAVFASTTGTAGADDERLARGALLIDSDAGDSVGKGRRHLWADDAEVSVTASTRELVTLRVVQPDGGAWRLEFRAPSTTPLAAGIFENAVGIFDARTSPGIRVEAPSAPCSSGSGRFQVHEVAFESTASGLRVVRFAADFEHRCGAAPGRLRGSIRLNSSRSTVLPFAGGD